MRQRRRFGVPANVSLVGRYPAVGACAADGAAGRAADDGGGECWGAGGYGLYDLLLQATDLWRLFVGLAIVVLVLVFPQGIAGSVQAVVGRHDRCGGARFTEGLGGVCAMDDLSFAVGTGETLAPIGPNGAGNSSRA